MEVRSMELEAGKYKEAPFRVIGFAVITDGVSSFGSMQMAF